MKISKYSFVLLVGFFLANAAFAQINFRQAWLDTFNAPELVGSDVVGIVENFAGFLIIVAGIIAGIGLLWSGITYMTAGNNSTRVTTAKAIFKNTVIGAVILFAVGIILNTIANVVSDPNYFF